MTEKSSSGQPIAEIEIGDEMPIALYRLYAEDGTLLVKAMKHGKHRG